MDGSALAHAAREGVLLRQVTPDAKEQNFRLYIEQDDRRIADLLAVASGWLQRSKRLLEGFTKGTEGVRLLDETTTVAGAGDPVHSGPISPLGVWGCPSILEEGTSHQPPHETPPSPL